MKIKWSGLGMTDGSGKIGGNVASKNRFGNYLRRKGQTLNPQTASQQFVRMLFGALSQAWRALTDAQRAAWRALALFVTINDQFGDGYSPNGNQLYIRINTNLGKVGIAAIDDPPVLAGAAALDVPTVLVDIGAGAANAMAISVPFSTNDASQDSSLYLEATPPVSSGITAGSVKNLYRSLLQGGTIPNTIIVGLITGASPANLTAADFSTGVAENYATLFGVPPAAGQKIFFRFSAINSTTGESSPIMVVESTVISTP
jgi:hypothetical protein